MTNKRKESHYQSNRKGSGMNQILHVCLNGEKENVSQQVEVGFKWCPWCGKEYEIGVNNMKEDQTSSMLYDTTVYNVLKERLCKLLEKYKEDGKHNPEHFEKLLDEYELKILLKH